MASKTVENLTQINAKLDTIASTIQEALENLSAQVAQTIVKLDEKISQIEARLEPARPVPVRQQPGFAPVKPKEDSTPPLVTKWIESTDQEGITRWRAREDYCSPVHLDILLSLKASGLKWVMGKDQEGEWIYSISDYKGSLYLWKKAPQRREVKA